MNDHNTVFISYRRSASRHLARLIFNDLRTHGYDAFLDVNTMDNGEFDTILLNQIAARAHFVLVLSKGSLERCANEGDWLTREMREAIRLKRNITSLFEEGFNFRDAQSFLPPDLRDTIPRYKGAILWNHNLAEGLAILRDQFLKQPFSGQIIPTHPAEASEVMKRMQQAAQTDPPLTTKVAYLTRAVERYNTRDLDGAIRDYNEALHLDPKDSLIYNNRGIAHYAKGDFDEAIRDYEEALRLNPSYRNAYSNRGNSRVAKGDLDGAISDYDEAIRLDPNNPLAYNNRGTTRNTQGDLDGAMRDFDEAIHLDPNYLDVYINRAFARDAKGDIIGAIADCRRYLDLGGGEVYNNRASMEQMISDLNKKR